MSLTLSNGFVGVSNQTGLVPFGISKSAVSYQQRKVQTKLLPFFGEQTIGSTIDVVTANYHIFRFEKTSDATQSQPFQKQKQSHVDHSPKLRHNLEDCAGGIVGLEYSCYSAGCGCAKWTFEDGCHHSTCRWFW